MGKSQVGLSERDVVLLDLARTLASSLDPAALYPVIHAHVCRILPLSGFAVYSYAAAGLLTPVYSIGEKEDSSGPFEKREMERLRAGDFVARPAAAARATMLAAPLIREHRLLGCIAVKRGQENPFRSVDVHFLLAVGRLAAVALDNARLYEEARTRSEEAERLEAAARDFSASFELPQVVQRVTNRIFEVVAAPVVLWLNEGSQARAAACVGGAVQPGVVRELPEDTVDELLRMAARPLAGLAAVPSEGASDGRLLVPLMFGGRLTAFVAVGPWREGAAPGPDRLRLLDRLAPHAAAAIENARLHAELRRLSLTDSLVQLPNRRQLDWFLEKEFAAALRDRPLCLVLFDLDRFKQYNDTYGHRAGDRALIRFADVLRAETRKMNLAARYGGEEFASVLSGTGQKGGMFHAERVRSRFEEVSKGRLTVSAGVAAYTSDMKTAGDLIMAADRALYRAKLEGRNRVCYALEGS